MSQVDDFDRLIGPAPKPLDNPLSQILRAAEAAEPKITQPRPSVVHIDQLEQDIAKAIDNPKKAFGDAKAGLSFIPMNVILNQVAPTMKLGAAKYGKKNWRVQPVEAATYYDAANRHMISWFEDAEDNDPDTGKSHLAHAICNLLIILDGLQRGEMIDNRQHHEVKTKGVGV